MNKLKYLFILFFLLFFISACKKDIVQVTNFDSIPKTLEFDYLKIKSKLEYIEGSQKNKATLHLRVKKDSIIWISVQSTIEAFRIIIKKDSVLVLDRLKKNYHALSYLDLQKKLGFELDYDFFESLITANIPQRMMDEGKQIKKDDMSYIVRKDGFYQFEYFVSSSLKHLEMIRVTEIPSNNSLEVDYNNYVKSNDIIYPADVTAKMSYITEKNFTKSDISINHTLFEIIENEELSFPFNVPDKYVRN
jgi:hypothetical protein